MILKQQKAHSLSNSLTITARMLLHSALRPIYGHELTGICKAARLNVVDVTQDERQYNSVPVDWYVIEQTNIDGIVIWQTASGTIYETCPGSEADKICDSLEEYISLE